MRTFLFGIFLGAAAALLYAPQTGNRTRSVLKDKLNKLTNDTADFVDSKSRDISNRMQGVSTQLNKAVDQISPKVDQMARDARETYNQVRENVNSVRDNMANKAQDVSSELKRESA